MIAKYDRKLDKEPRFSLANLKLVLRDCLRLAKNWGVPISPNVADRVAEALPFNKKSFHSYFKSLKIIRRIGFSSVEDAKSFMAFYIFLPLYGIEKFESYGGIVCLNEEVENP